MIPGPVIGMRMLQTAQLSGVSERKLEIHTRERRQQWQTTTRTTTTGHKHNRREHHENCLPYGHAPELRSPRRTVPACLSACLCRRRAPLVRHGRNCGRFGRRDRVVFWACVRVWGDCRSPAKRRLSTGASRRGRAGGGGSLRRTRAPSPYHSATVKGRRRRRHRRRRRLRWLIARVRGARNAMPGMTGWTTGAYARSVDRPPTDGFQVVTESRSKAGKPTRLTVQIALGTGLFISLINFIATFWFNLIYLSHSFGDYFNVEF